MSNREDDHQPFRFDSFAEFESAIVKAECPFAEVEDGVDRRTVAAVTEAEVVIVVVGAAAPASVEGRKRFRLPSVMTLSNTIRVPARKRMAES